MSTATIGNAPGTTNEGRWERAVPVYGFPVVNGFFLALVAMTLLAFALTAYRELAGLGPVSGMNDADGPVDQLPGVRMWPPFAGHRRRPAVELLLDRFPVEMEHALTAGGGGDLYVDLRHDPAGTGKYSGCAGAALVL